MEKVSEDVPIRERLGRWEASSRATVWGKGAPGRGAERAKALRWERAWGVGGREGRPGAAARGAGKGGAGREAADGRAASRRAAESRLGYSACRELVCPRGPHWLEEMGASETQPGVPGFQGSASPPPDRASFAP